MKLVQVHDLQGGEVLAKQVMTNDYQLLLKEGTTMKTEYIERLKELNIYSVYINDIEDEKTVEENAILKEEVKTDCLLKVKDVLEHHTHNISSGLEEITETANIVVSDILSDERVIKKVYEIKERSSDIYEHSVSVCSLAILTSLHLGIENEKIHEIGIAALLHDLGLRYITIPYIDTDIEKLNEKEKEEYKKHTVYGYSALANEDWITEDTKKMILFHHERIDGSGYPLHTKEVLREHQVLALCETFDELLCAVGCQRMKVHEAIEYIKTLKVKGFEQDIVESFLKFTAVYPTGTKVRLSNNAVGVVVNQNENFPDRPTIRIITNASGDEVENEQIINLLQTLNLIIVEVIN